MGSSKWGGHSFISSQEGTTRLRLPAFDHPAEAFPFYTLPLARFWAR